MKNIAQRNKNHRPLAFVTLFHSIAFSWLIGLLVCISPSTLKAAVVDAQYFSASDVAITAASYTATGNTIAEIDVSNCGFHKQITYSQSSAADPTLDSDSPFNFYSYVSPGTMGALLASSSLTPPIGGTGIAGYEKGSNGLQLRQTYRTQAELNAAYPAGNYLMSICTSTPNTYQVALSLGSENYPIIPKITSVSNATWENGAIKITNPANPVVITWNNPANRDTLFQVDNTNIRKSDSSPSSSFTIPANSFQNNSLYRASVQLSNGSSSTSIGGLPNSYAHSGYQTQVQWMIQVGNLPAADSAIYLAIKNHNQAQSSNDDPVDAPNPLPDADRAPYSFTAESAVGGNLSGPSGTSFLLGFHADNNAIEHEYLSGTFLSAAALNASHPHGSYTFPGGIAVSLPADNYPATAKILSVNGAAPVWNNEGQLALDPTVDNTIAWSAVTVPNFDTQGHQTVSFENYQDYNFNSESFDIERGAMTEFTTPLTSITIPKFTMTPTYTYHGTVGYATVPTFAEVSTGVYKIGAYETTNQYMAVALKPQTITFGTVPAKLFPSAVFTLGASASSGLPVTYEVISGPATVSGNAVTIVGTGTVTMRAKQSGTAVYASAVNVTQSFEVSYANKLAEFRATTGLASDGSQDLQTPANDGVCNLLKYAFNMIGSGVGQVTSLTQPNVQIVGVSGSAGLPRHGSNAGKLMVTYIRRKATSAPGVSYIEPVPKRGFFGMAFKCVQMSICRNSIPPDCELWNEIPFNF